MGNGVSLYAALVDTDIQFSRMVEPTSTPTSNVEKFQLLYIPTSTCYYPSIHPARRVAYDYTKLKN